MGSLCSKSSAHEGGHTLLGPDPANPAAPARPNPSDPRTAAAQAAERRMRAAQLRGTNEANPSAGKLSGQLAKQNSSKGTPQTQQEERLVWD